MENIVWRAIVNCVRFAISREQRYQTCGACFLGGIFGWSWTGGQISAWLVTLFPLAIPIVKAGVCAGFSALVTNTISYLFKKYTGQLEKKPPKESRKRKRA